MPEPRKLTETYIKGLKFDGKSYVVRDTHTTGLMVGINKRSKSYKVQRDLWKGQRGRQHFVKTVRHTLGSTDELSLDEARSRAQEVISLIKRGIDPNANDQSIPASDMTVGELWRAYEQWLQAQDRSPRTIEAFHYYLEKYLKDWREMPVCDIRKSICRDRHELITERHGPSPANHVMWALRAAYNYALKQDDDDQLRANPVGGVDFHPMRRREAIILPDDLPDWWRRTGELKNPLRRVMHRLGLLSGLRPGARVSIERAWIDIPGRVISFPRMKSGRSFDLPLSEPMVGLVEEAIRMGDALYNDPPWLFPTRSNDGRQIIATQVWREKSMPGETGHILRHTYRTMADRLGVPQSRARALLDHKQPGIDAHYLHSNALREELLADQERMSAHILETANVL